MGEVKRPTRDGPRELGRGHTTMERRKFVVGLGALASGSAAAMGTGAFSSVQADRTVSVEVADDSEAYLRLEGDGGDNSDYVTSDGTDGVLTIDLDANNSSNVQGGGSGVNPDARTRIDDLFVIENQGTQEVEITLNKSSGNDSNDYEDYATFYINNDYSTELDGTNFIAGADETISLEVDTRDSGLTGEDQILDTVTFNADEV